MDKTGPLTQEDVDYLFQINSDISTKVPLENAGRLRMHQLVDQCGSLQGAEVIGEADAFIWPTQAGRELMAAIRDGVNTHYEKWKPE